MNCSEFVNTPVSEVLRLFCDMSPVVPFEFNVTNDGFWGDTTSTLDWCEGNYEVSWVQGLLGDRETNSDTFIC